MRPRLISSLVEYFDIYTKRDTIRRHRSPAIFKKESVTSTFFPRYIAFYIIYKASTFKPLLVPARKVNIRFYKKWDLEAKQELTGSGPPFWQVPFFIVRDSFSSELAAGSCNDVKIASHRALCQGQAWAYRIFLLFLYGPHQATEDDAS